MLKNAKQLPKVYYGLHMANGVAEYREAEKPFRVLIEEEVIKSMNATFPGKPVYVKHVDQVDLNNLQLEADGYVVESFYNPADGKHWAKFIVVSDKGHEAIRSGWKLSNAYIPKQFSAGGQWHGVDYDREVMHAEYEHLAIVPNPRYEESVIMDTEQFKAYNSEKQQEIKRLANSKEGEKPMLSFFKKTKLENSADLEGTVVILPKSKAEKTISQLVNEVDDYTLKMKEPQMANGDHHVMVGDEKMSVNALLEKHKAMCQEMADMKKPKENDEDMDPASIGGTDIENADEPGEEEMKKKKENEEAPEVKEKKEAPVKNEAKEKREKQVTDEGLLHFEALKNAPMTVIKNKPTLDLSQDKVNRGKARYGSN